MKDDVATAKRQNPSRAVCDSALRGLAGIKIGKSERTSRQKDLLHLPISRLRPSCVSVSQ